MKKFQIKGGIIISLAVWFLSHEAVIAHVTSCILGDHVAGCSSGLCDNKRPFACLRVLNESGLSSSKDGKRYPLDN